MKQNILEDLKELTIYKDEPLEKYTFTKTGGPVDYLVFPKSTKELQKAILYANKHNIPWIVLGNASNLIVKDGGIRGFVFMLSELKEIKELRENTLYAEAGAKLIDLSYAAGHENLTGLEFACGIPGSVGGALFMNAGAYDHDISEVLESVDVLTPAGQLKTYSNSEMAFSYRHSFVQDSKDVILGGTFHLEKGNLAEIKEKMATLTNLRQLKQPLEYPSCGSVFKRPKGHYTGQLIQEAGLQGMIMGGAQISKKHAGFIINLGNATATDYLNLIHHIQEVIWEKFAVHLETEVRILGEDK